MGRGTAHRGSVESAVVRPAAAPVAPSGRGTSDSQSVGKTVIQRMPGGGYSTHQASTQNPGGPGAHPPQIIQRAGGGDNLPPEAETAGVAGEKQDQDRSSRESTSKRINELTELIESIEDRILAQLERRGGRYQGAF